MAGDKSNPNNYVQTVTCPECGREWTGMFSKPPVDAPCRDCVAKDPDKLRKGHPDVTIGT